MKWKESVFSFQWCLAELHVFAFFGLPFTTFVWPFPRLIVQSESIKSYFLFISCFKFIFFLLAFQSPTLVLVLCCSNPSSVIVVHPSIWLILFALFSFCCFNLSLRHCKIFFIWLATVNASLVTFVLFPPKVFF